MLLACFPSSMINPNVFLAWLGFDMYLAMCMSMLFLSSLWNHSQLGGGSDADILMSTLAYSWVQRCSEVASCGTTQLQDKYLLLFLCLISANYLFYELK